MHFESLNRHLWLVKKNTCLTNKKTALTNKKRPTLPFFFAWFTLLPGVGWGGNTLIKDLGRPIQKNFGDGLTFEGR